MGVLRRIPLVLSMAALFTGAVSASAGARQTAPATDAVSAWNASAGKAAVAACISPEGPGPAGTGRFTGRPGAPGRTLPAPGTDLVDDIPQRRLAEPTQGLW